MSFQTKPTAKYWIIAVIALLWNLAGVANFVFQVFFTDQLVASMNDAQRELILTTPSWMKAVFGVATILGLLGSIGLLVRMKWAVPALLVSMIAVIIQMGYSGLATDALAIMEQSPFFPIIVVLFSVFLWLHSRTSDRRGYLK